MAVVTDILHAHMAKHDIKLPEPGQRYPWEAILAALPELTQEQRDAHFRVGNQCPMCGGSGWTTKDVLPGQPDFGKTFPCRNCNYPVHKFTFKDWEKTDGTKEARKAAQDWAEDKLKLLTISGGTGSGKTHLAYAAAAHMYDNGMLDCKVMFIPMLMNQLRAGYDEHAERPYQQIIDSMMRRTPLIMDDIGAGKPTEWVQEQLEIIINWRVEDKLPTLFTTNMNHDRLAEVCGDRVASRVFDTTNGEVVYINARQDYRTGKER